MSRQKIRFIINPTSGKSHKTDLPSQIGRVLNTDRFEYDIRISEYAGHAKSLAQEAVAAGYDIEDERVVAIDMGPGKPPLEVTVLDMVHPASEDNPAPVHIFYAYWFIGKGRVTPSHVQRMIWMATDRILHGVSHRWAYVAVSGLRAPSSNFHLQEIADFASALHPQILRPDFESLDPAVAH